jgi:hypothetical protein
LTRKAEAAVTEDERKLAQGYARKQARAGVSREAAAAAPPPPAAPAATTASPLPALIGLPPIPGLSSGGGSRAAFAPGQ